jgi:heat-inducible transcriptional repressor
MEALTTRQEKILRLVVREYVRSAAPVGSRILVDDYGLPVSSATVRNELSRLEELGYLSHPHTSAGREPTLQGYRYFVRRLVGDVTLPLRERTTISHQFYQARQDLEQWMPLAASVLSQTARLPAVVTSPQAAESRYKHLQLIATHGNAVLLILVLQGGAIKQQMLNLLEPVDQETLSEASDRLNQLCAGLAADDIESRACSLPPLETDVARLVASILGDAVEGISGKIYRDGLSSVLQQPEFAEGGNARGLVRVVEERSLLESVFCDALGPEVGLVRVFIGGEGRWDELRTCSLVLARYGVQDTATGMLGVVGPTRMVYARAISAVGYVAGVMSDLVYESYAG